MIDGSDGPSLEYPFCLREMSEKTTLSAFETHIPARLDRLPWNQFHWLVVIALGITWTLDGLEVTLNGAISGVLQEPGVMNFLAPQIGSTASAYLIGAVGGALVFGYLTDLWGRKKLFFVTLAIYLAGTLLTAFAWNFWSFAAFRLITGAGIGGEYSAIGSAVDELIPAEFRGRVDLIINGSYWLGAAAGAASTLVILDPHIVAPKLGWRFGFGVGAMLGLFILLMRKHVPESPRWLMTHGQRDEAEAVMDGIETRSQASLGQQLPPAEGEPLVIHPRESFGFGLVARRMYEKYLSRSFLSLSLITSQAFLYNAVFFTYALILTRFYHVPGGAHGAVPTAVRGGEFPGAAAAGAFFRHPRAPADDFVHVRDFGGIAGADWMAFRARRPFGKHPDDCVDGDFLLRVGSGEFRIFDGERNFSAGNTGAGNRVLLRAGNRNWRGRGALAVWDAHRLGVRNERLLRLLDRRSADVWRGDCGSGVRRESGARKAGNTGGAAFDEEQRLGPVDGGRPACSREFAEVSPADRVGGFAAGPRQRTRIAYNGSEDHASAMASQRTS